MSLKGDSPTYFYTGLFEDEERAKEERRVLLEAEYILAQAQAQAQNEELRFMISANDFVTFTSPFRGQNDLSNCKCINRDKYRWELCPIHSNH